MRATQADAWEAPGAMGASDRGASVLGVFPANVGSNEAVPVALGTAGIAAVQRWVDGGQNNGIVLANATNTHGIDVHCRETAIAAERPRLTVVYTP
jgi:hypothetical protein